MITVSTSADGTVRLTLGCDACRRTVSDIGSSETYLISARLAEGWEIDPHLDRARCPDCG